MSLILYAAPVACNMSLKRLPCSHCCLEERSFNAVWSCLAQSCSYSNVTLFVQSGRMRAITQGELERIKIYVCRAVQTALYCCLCSLRELELLHKETVYLCINLFPWYILIRHWNKILNRQCEEIELFAEQLLISILWAICFVHRSSKLIGQVGHDKFSVQLYHQQPYSSVLEQGHLGRAQS